MANRLIALTLAPLLAVASSSALATTYYSTCECDPGVSQSGVVSRILSSWRNVVENSDIVSILDTRPESNGQYYYVNYEYRDGTFTARANGYASPAAGGGQNPYFGGPWGGGGSPGWHWHYSSTCTIGGVPCVQIGN